MTEHIQEMVRSSHPGYPRDKGEVCRSEGDGGETRMEELEGEVE